MLDPSDTFVRRHVGPDEQDVQQMLELIGYDSLESLVDAAIPSAIRMKGRLPLGPPRGEREVIDELRSIADTNQVNRSFIGMGYHDCIVPPVIQRNILENPGWYTQYTPYQSEIAQGRLEALLNFQTMVSDLTGLPLANASLLDEATAAAEAMAMCVSIVPAKKPDTRPAFFVSSDCHPQTIDVVRSRAGSMGVELVVGDPRVLDRDAGRFCGVLVQYPATDGRLVDYSHVVDVVHQAGGLVVFAADLLALTLIKPPGEFGGDIAIGSTQRLGVPMGGGGPHAAYMATRAEYARKIPGRIVGVSRDNTGRPAYRLAIQTREQHIRRDRATSNICTAQVLLAIMSGLYAAYHGPDGLRRIAERVFALTAALREGVRRLGYDTGSDSCFDTIRIHPGKTTAEQIRQATEQRGINLRYYDDGGVGISLDEVTTREDVTRILECFVQPGGMPGGMAADVNELLEAADTRISPVFARCSEYLTNSVFNRYHSETEMLRYMTRLQSRDLSLTSSMIPLGSCTMKLNGTSEMLPVTWSAFSNIHPFTPPEQLPGYETMLGQLESWIAGITGFDGVSLQPNAGSQGEYTGLMVIRAYHAERGEGHRDVCLIPTSAHGTNPASAVIAGLRVIPVACDDNGNIDIADLRAKATEHRDTLAALMMTYPSTHGVFESSVQEVCSVVHDQGGQVYLDGANLNAMVGLCLAADLGADVVHLNLHKTFCIPHGGGGPGMGPIATASHLTPFLPGHPVVMPMDAGEKAIGAISAAPYGSPSILPITWTYIALMGGPGLTYATQVAILNANYMARRLESQYDVVYRGVNGRVAHEFILDCRSFDKNAGVKIDDIAKRLMDYGFHAPTMSWPVPGTLMIEPTESESRRELDRYCDALIAIREEIREIEDGKADRVDNVLKNAPHTIEAVCADDWSHAYSREKAAYPAGWLREYKFWPPVGRIDNPYGDRHLVCSCGDWA